MWEFDPSRRVIDVVLRLGSARPIAFTVAVCAPDRARAGAHPLLRLDGSSWRVLPAIFVASFGVLVPKDAPIHPTLGNGTQLVLSHAPADVDAELSSL